ncbi:MAG: VanW family protein [Acidimicrobiales bacterium]
MSRLRVPALIAGGVTLVSLLAVVAAWAIGTGGKSGRVMPNVSVAGRDVGGVRAGRLGEVVEELAQQFGQTPVRIVTPFSTVESNAGAVGLTVDREATRAAARQAGQPGAGVLRPFAWFVSLLDSRELPVHLALDPATVQTSLDGRPEVVRTPPVEPSIAYSDGKLAITPGAPGEGLDGEQLRAALSGIERLVRFGDEPIELRVDSAPIPPRFGEADAAALARRVTEATAEPFEIDAEGVVRKLEGEELRRLAAAAPGAEALELRLDEERLGKVLAELFADAERAPVNAKLSLDGEGKPAVTPGRDGLSCCAPDAAAAVTAALAAGRAKAAVSFVHTPPARTAEHLNQLGVTQRVAEFTTRHNPGEPRVTNIHRIADLVRGTVIEPGATFSVNKTVGRRTQDKGFVPAPVIYDGVFNEDIGGGVSQFATTLFNAAFLGGLDLVTYQSHTIYISRYPYGREATLSWPGPDLELRNSSPYGVMIWPTYTASTITVALYSTKWVDVEQVNQVKRAEGVCTRVETQRKRTIVKTGESKLDSIHATYRPQEGARCSGGLTDAAEQKGLTTTTAPPATTTTAAPGPSAPGGEAPAPSAPGAAKPPEGGGAG